MEREDDRIVVVDNGDGAVFRALVARGFSVHQSLIEIGLDMRELHELPPPLEVKKRYAFSSNMPPERPRIPYGLKRRKFKLGTRP